LKIIDTYFDLVHLIETKKYEDNRGWFSEFFNANSEIPFLNSFNVVQHNVSFNKLRGTLRGLHFQTGDYAQNKLISVQHGSVLDVFVDLRSNSQTYGKWASVVLDATRSNLLFIPKGFAHGYLTLEEGVLFSYLVDRPYSKENSSGVKWNDKTLDINWGISDPIISKEDDQLANLEKDYFFA
jgi:dTDP-4-dehydrorhamnose 3,5-epimerase